MPFYEYECPNCGYRDEVLQKINDKPLKKCPTCGKNGLKKLMSAPVFRLKGSGWYETDFKTDKDNKRNLAGADKEESKSDTKAETKPDAKSDAKSDAKTDATKPDSSKSDGPKSDKPKPDAPKPAEKASRGASKSAAKRDKPKAKPSRPAKRLTRR
ncbi:MAG TPA: FmdB family zinc ribbon protein [Steroidobacteraceae bacterium]|jgi:putative FmdB family regulatory protein|nr:FmdB family zinc ribbon protein [Steroidobacteraceae bacterium]